MIKYFLNGVDINSTLDITLKFYNICYLNCLLITNINVDHLFQSEFLFVINKQFN